MSAHSYLVFFGRAFKTSISFLTVQL